MYAFHLKRYYNIEFTKNRQTSNQVCVAATCALRTVLWNALSNRPVPFERYPFWISEGEVWLELEQATNLPTRADTTNVIFLQSGNLLKCYFKKMEPFDLSHYADVQMLKLLENSPNTSTKQKKDISSILKWNKHPSASQEAKLWNIVHPHSAKTEVIEIS